MHLLQGAIQHYAWGTTDAIARLLQRQPDGTPQAEYWLGTHPLGPARAGEVTLDKLIADHSPLLGDGVGQAFGSELPFMMKVLSARHALSIQVHPSREQAEQGYARENAAGIPLDARHRVYSDAWPKPEVMIALEPFETLSGFRDPLETASLFIELGVADELGSLVTTLSQRRGAPTLIQVFLEILTLEEELARILDRILAAAAQHADAPGTLGDFARTALELNAVFPRDRGVLAALLMNRVTLRPGEAVFLPAGQLHAHLRGTGIEVLANSDNVIRGGLTPKHVDVRELVEVVDFEPREPRVLSPSRLRPGLATYDFSCPEFEVWQVNGMDGTAVLPGEGSARILLVVDGSLHIRENSGSTVSLHQGDAILLGADERDLQFWGDGLAFLSASGVR